MINSIAHMRHSPLPLELLVEKQGKRILDERLIRAMKSRISLKFPLASLDE